MRRVLIVVVVGAVLALAGWYIWGLSQQTSTAAVSGLLPRETIFLAHMPDLNGARNEWHHSDVYLLYREPAVQDFLRKPLTHLPKANTASHTLSDIELLAPKHAFLALPSIEGNSPKLVGGFRFRGRSKDAEQIVGKWRSNFLVRNPGARQEKLQYRGHEIDMINATPFGLATAYAGAWFFAATDVTQLKGLLDRADGRRKDRNETLANDDAYRAAISHRPANYAAFFYLQPKVLAQRIAALRATLQGPVATEPASTSGLEQIRSISGAMRFEDGKIRDSLFLGMPKQESRVGETRLSRSSLTLGTKETFFYLSSLISFQEIETLDPAVIGTAGKLFQTLADNGITLDNWKAAFGPELGSLADWPSTAHWPGVVIALPVIDMPQADKIVEAIMRSDADSDWTQMEKDGVQYFSMQSAASFLAITPTIALSSHVLIAGLNPVFVEEAMKRSMGTSSELADSKSFKSAARLVPSPTHLFAYIDTALLYSRLDASLRPMLLMAAAFMPKITSHVDLTKLPSPEVITKHLSPIVSSQRYEHDGYVTESIGPITFDQSVVGLAVLGGLGSKLRQKVTGTLPPWSSSPAPSVSQPPAPSATPVISPTP